jgi:hypothetical protein
MLDPAMLRRRSFVLVLIAAALLSISAFAGLIYVSIWLQTVLDRGAISVGLVTLPVSGIAFFVAGGLHGVSPRWTVGGGLAIIGVGDLLMLGLDGSSGWAAVLPGLAVIGVGTGIAIPTLVAAAMAAVLAGSRATLDAAIRSAVGGALGTTFLVAGCWAWSAGRWLHCCCVSRRRSLRKSGSRRERRRRARAGYGAQ